MRVGRGYSFMFVRLLLLKYCSSAPLMDYQSKFRVIKFCIGPKCPHPTGGSCISYVFGQVLFEGGLARRVFMVFSDTCS